MSEHSDSAVEAFADLLSFAGQTVTIGGTNYTAHVSEMTADEVLVAGGTAEGGGFRVKVKISDFANDPAKRTAVVFSGRTLATGECIRRDGHLEIECMDYAR